MLASTCAYAPQCRQLDQYGMMTRAADAAVERCDLDRAERVLTHRRESVEVRDVRFPTSDFQDGSDAVHKDPDYSVVYVILHTR